MVPTAAYLHNARTAGQSRRFVTLETKGGPHTDGRNSDGPNVLGLVTLAARTNVELDGLTFLEGAVAAALDV